MGWEEGQRKKKIWLHSVHLFSTVSITLILPLSYLVLARLATARFLVSTTPSEPPRSPLASFHLYTNPNILCALVSTISLHALIQSIIRGVSSRSGRPGLIFNPRVREAWFYLVALEACVGLGIEGSKDAGDREAVFEGSHMLTKVVLLLGMHQTMVCWCRSMVRPIINGWVLGGAWIETPRWAERAALGASYGFLWWWKLRHEVDALVAVVEVKKYMKMRVGLSDALGWWWYHLTLVVGISSIANGLVWVGMFLFCRRMATEENTIETQIGENEVQLIY